MQKSKYILRVQQITGIYITALSLKARQAGKLNNEMLLELKKKIAPMLSKEQLEKLDEVLKMIMT